MRLAIAAIATCLPPQQVHENLLGSAVAGTYGHLYEPAGAHSRAPTVRRGATVMFSPAYSVPTAPASERTSDMGSQAVAKLLAGAPGHALQVGAVLHVQCTLDQQIVGSGCLRIQHDHFPDARSAITVGQLGTAGTPTALWLAALSTAGGKGGLACVSASDKWLAPMIRRVPGVVTYGDASAACLVGQVDEVTAPLALIEAIHTHCQPPEASPWSAEPAQQRAHLLDIAVAAIEGLLAKFPQLERSTLALSGDSYGADFDAALKTRCALGGEILTAPQDDIHLSSAAQLFAIERVLERARAQAAALQAVVWTASSAGYAGALLLNCANEDGKTSLFPH